MHPLKENIPPRHPEFTVRYLFFPHSSSPKSLNPYQQPTRGPHTSSSPPDLSPFRSLLPSRASRAYLCSRSTARGRREPESSRAAGLSSAVAAPLPLLSSPPLPHPSADDVRVEIQGKVRRAGGGGVAGELRAGARRRGAATATGSSTGFALSSGASALPSSDWPPPCPPELPLQAPTPLPAPSPWRWPAPLSRRREPTHRRIFPSSLSPSDGAEHQRPDAGGASMTRSARLGARSIWRPRDWNGT
jgi:hypothetical protein